MRRGRVPGMIALFVAATAAWRRRAERRRAVAQLASPEPRPSAPDLPGPRTQPDASAPRFVSVPWALAIDEARARERAELPVTYTLLGDRMELDRIDVRETSSQVFVTVLARWRPPEGGRVLYGVAREATLRLERPLGDRALVHAPDQLDELRAG